MDNMYATELELDTRVLFDLYKPGCVLADPKAGRNENAKVNTWRFYFSIELYWAGGVRLSS